MKIAILSRSPSLYSTSRLVEAAKQRGHEARVINPLKCYMNITAHRPEIYYREERLDGFDAVIPRIGASITFYGLAVLRQFEMMGVYCLNESVAIGRSRDKLRSLQLLSRKGIGMPVTAFGHSPDDTRNVIELVEVNSSPGLRGIEECTHKDVAGRVIEFIEKHAVPGKNKTKGKG